MNGPLPSQRTEALFELGEPLDQSLVQGLDTSRRDLTVQYQTGLEHAHLIQDESLESVYMRHHLGILPRKLWSEEGLLILCDAAHHVGVDDTLQPHAKWINIPVRLGGVLRHQSSKLPLHALHGLAGVLHRRQQLRSLLDHFEPSEDPRQSRLRRQRRPLDPQRLELVLAIHRAAVQRSIEREFTHVVHQVEGDHAFRNFGTAAS